jgi:hypothetical protein
VLKAMRPWQAEQVNAPPPCVAVFHATMLFSTVAAPFRT